MSQTASKYRKGKLYNLPLAELNSDPNQPRKHIDKQALSELTRSIASHGVLEPILARLTDHGTLLIVSGERRYHAATEAGLATVPVLITQGDPLEIAIVENLLRENLTAIEEAEAVERLKDDHDYQLADLSMVLGKAASTLSEILSLNKLPKSIKDDCRSNPKTPRHILTKIAKHRDSDKMSALYQKYKERGLTEGESRRVRPPKTDTEAVDLSFLQACLKKLSSLDLQTLNNSQILQLTGELERLGAAVKASLKALKPSTSKQ